MSYGLGHLDASTLADQAYSKLRAGIISGELPEGVKLTDRGLAESLAVSPTPVREAIRRLEQDRLVERTGPRSVRVAVHSPDNRAELAQVADALKAAAARIAATKITDGELEELERILDKADAERGALYKLLATEDRNSEPVRESLSRLIALIREFHGMINRCSRNDTLLHLLDTVEAFSLAARRKALQDKIARDERGPHGRYHQHRQILEALRLRDQDLVESLTLMHSRAGSMDLLTNAT